MRDPVTGCPISHPELCLHHLGAELAAAWADAQVNPGSPIARAVFCELAHDTVDHLRASGWVLARVQTLGSMAQLAQAEVRLDLPENVQPLLN